MSNEGIQQGHIVGIIIDKHDLSITQAGMPVCKAWIAVNTDQSEERFPVTFWGDEAEKLARGVDIGDKVTVYYQLRNWNVRKLNRQELQLHATKLLTPHLSGRKLERLMKQANF